MFQSKEITFPRLLLRNYFFLDAQTQLDCTLVY